MSLGGPACRGTRSRPARGSGAGPSATVGGGAATRAALAAVAAVAALLAGGCGGTPWFLGAPLDGHPSIPARSRVVTVAEHRHNAEAARAAGDGVDEIAELEAIEERDALHDAERARLVELLLARAGDWIALQRPIPLVADLRNVVTLAPGRRLALARPLRRAERAAGDTWLAMGQSSQAEEEYRHAERDGMGGMTFRFRAVWGAAVGDLDLPTLEEALTELPGKVLATFSEAYLAAGGARPAVLDRAWAAARVHGPADLARRLDERRRSARVAGAPGEGTSPSGVPSSAPGALAPGAEGPEPPPPATGVSPPTALPAPASPTPAASAAVTPALAANPNPAPTPPRPPALPRALPAGVVPPEPPDDDPWRDLYRGPTLARRLMPAARRHPEVLAAGPRSRELAVHLLAEDPTSPDSLELAARIEALAGRVDSAASKLEDLVFYSGDKVRAAARVAVVWQEAGQPRRACAAWEQAALAGAVDDPHWCQFLRCAAETPGASNLDLAERFVSGRAPNLSCARPGPRAPSAPISPAFSPGLPAVEPPPAPAPTPGPSSGIPGRRRGQRLRSS